MIASVARQPPNLFLKIFLHHTPVCNEANVILSGIFFIEWSLIYIPPSTAKKRSLLICEIQFPILLRLFNTTRKWNVVTKNKNG